LAGLASAATIVVVGSVAFAPPASAEFTENTIGCSGHATITDKKGQTYQVDAQDKTATVPRNGSAEWAGAVTTVTHDHFGEIVIKVGPASVKLDSWGPKPNTSNGSSKSGTKSLSALEKIPPGKYELTGFHQGNEGRCAGKITLNVAGSPLSSPAGIGVTVLTAVAALGVLLAAVRGRPILGAISGLLLGIFGALELVFLKVLGSGSPLLMILPVVLLVVATVLGFLRRGAGGGGGGVSAPAA
jgi:hypothetical protein